MSGKHKITYSALVLLVLLIFPLNTRAEATPLFSEMGIYGGQVNVVAVDPDDPLVVYAGSYGGDGLFKTTDGGLNWTTIDGFRNNIIYDIAISKNGSRVWVAHSYFVSYSPDQGKTWEQAYPGSADNESRTCYSVAIDPNDWLGNTVYIGTGGPNDTDTNGAIFITTNNGSTWTKELFPGSYNIWNISFNTKNRGEVWAASRESSVSTNGKIYMRQGYLVDWYEWDQAVLGSLMGDVGYVDEIAAQSGDEMVFASGGYGIMRFINDSSSVADRYFSFLFSDACRALAIDPESSDIVYAGLEDKVAISSDSGATWDDDFPVSESGPFLSLAVAGSDPDVIFGGTLNRGVFVSEDAAATWSAVNSGLLATTIYDTDISSQDSGKIIAASLSGVYLKDGAAAEWERIADESAYSVAFHPTDDDVIYAGFGRRIGKTSDGGSTWSYRTVSTSAETHHVSSIAVSANAPNTVFAGISYASGATGGEIVKIIDSGSNFSSAALLSVFNSGVPVNSVVFHPDHSSIMFAGTGRFFAPAEGPGALYTSTNSGSTWTGTTLQNVVVNNISISTVDADVIYAACGDTNLEYSGIYRSRNGGVSWGLLTGGLPQNLAVADIKTDGSVSDVVYAALYRGYNSCSDPACSDYNGIYATDNGGTYWSQIGLSDYYLYDVNSYSSGSSSRVNGAGSSRTLSYPESSVVAGTGSGAYSTSMTSGTGTLVGYVYDYTSQEPITDAVIESSLGPKCLTDDSGYFILFASSGDHRINIWAPDHASSTYSSKIISTGQVTDMGDVYLSAGSSGSSGSTCFLESILGLRSSAELDELREFRNTVLSRTGLGKKLIDVYYKSGADFLEIVQENPELKKRCLENIYKLFPFIRAKIAGNKINLSAEVKASIYALISDLKKVSSPCLKKDIKALETNIEKIISN